MGKLIKFEDSAELSGGTPPDLDEAKGAFMESLVRGNKQIKKDRAASISEDAQMTYKRSIEDMEMEIKKLKRTRENMLDMSPENTQSLIVASQFDAKTFVERDQAIGFELRNLVIKLDIAKNRYQLLFT